MERSWLIKIRDDLSIDGDGFSFTRDERQKFRTILERTKPPAPHILATAAAMKDFVEGRN